MYAQPSFRISDANELKAFIAARRFGTLVVSGPEGPVAAHLPMILQPGEGHGVLEGHVARSNPVAGLAAAGGRAIALFHGSDAYVTPSLYPSKREHGRTVPTWNYIAVEAGGALEAFSDPAELRTHVAELTDLMESDAETPWAVSDAPDDYISKMTGAITGLRLRIDRIEGMRKLSQNRPEPDRAGVLAGFSNSPHPSARDLADHMSKDTASR
ncbi:MAG: FMN-binding negative transcriptional regulator [Alphaproteobacteria bacterium]|nr:FMN-binding negative transcriptional regulator [Alphaproteobacteria bacterium]